MANGNSARGQWVSYRHAFFGVKWRWGNQTFHLFGRDYNAYGRLLAEIGECLCCITIKCLHT